VLTPGHMLAQLGQRFEFLVSRRRDAIPRHRTLRGAIEWSYQLLTPELQKFLARLSVFRGGWTAEAVQAICEEALALDHLSQLQECSLIISHETGMAMRFGMLETLREFAAEQLPPPDRTRCERRHADYYLSVAHTSRPEDEDEGRWLDLMEAELDNLRAALEWSLRSDPDHALRLATALGDFWDGRVHWVEGLEIVRRALVCAPNAPMEVRVAALRSAGTLAHNQGEFSQARELAEERLAIRRLQGDQRNIANTLADLASVAHMQADVSARRTFTEERLSICRELEDGDGIRDCQFEIAMLSGDNDTVLSMQEEDVQAARRRGDRGALASGLNNLGIVVHIAGDLARARQLLAESVQLYKELNPDGARFPLIHLAGVTCRLGEDAEARSLLIESLRTCRRLGHKRLIAECLEHLAEVALGEKQPGSAARLLGAADAIREATSFANARHERLLAAVREVLGEAAFTAAWHAGRALTWREAADDALGE
jgi:hypothetical protein